MIAQQVIETAEETRTILGAVLTCSQYNALVLYRNAQRNDEMRANDGEWNFHGYREPSDFVNAPSESDCKYLVKCGLLGRGGRGRYRLTLSGKSLVSWGWREEERSEEIRALLNKHFPYTPFKVAVSGTINKPVYLIEWRSEQKENPTETEVANIIPVDLRGVCYLNIPF